MSLTIFQCNIMIKVDKRAQQLKLTIRFINMMQDNYPISLSQQYQLEKHSAV